MVVAKKMKETFGDAVDLSIYTNDSEEAKKYNLKASTTVFVDGVFVPLDVALSEKKMEEFLESESESSKQDSEKTHCGRYSKEIQ